MLPKQHRYCLPTFYDQVTKSSSLQDDSLFPPILRFAKATGTVNKTLFDQITCAGEGIE